MAEAEQPERLNPNRQVTVDDVRQLMGASTPHFALQLRNRIQKLIDGLGREDPAWIEGQREIARLERIAFTGRDARRAGAGGPARAALQRPGRAGALRAGRHPRLSPRGHFSCSTERTLPAGSSNQAM